MTRLTQTLSCVAALALAVGCKTEPAEAPETEQAAKEKASVADSAPPKADSCVGPLKEGPAQTFEAGGRQWELAGSKLTLNDSDLKSLTLGAVSDIKEDSPENKDNLQKISKWFQEQQVDAIVVAGDSGETAEQIVASLEILAETGLPLFNIIGNREGKQAHADAMAKLKQRFPHVFDLNHIRQVDTAAARLVSLPGYYDANYIHAEDGCQYSVEDVQALSVLVKDSPTPVVVISHGSHRQTGKEGIDRTHENANVGDPELTKLIESHNIPFGIFGNVHEAGGRATNRAGDALLPQDAAQEQLYLNPGPADGVIWKMNDGTKSAGMAGLLKLEGGKASYKIHRLPHGEAEAQAKKTKGKKSKKR